MAEMSMEEKQAYESFIEKVRQNYSEADAKMIEAAYKKASAAHIGQTRDSGQPYIIHPIAVAEILLSLGMDAQSLVSALLHDVVEDTDVCIDEIGCASVRCGRPCDGVTKLDKVPLESKEEHSREHQKNAARHVSGHKGNNHQAVGQTAQYAYPFLRSGAEAP